MAKIIKLTPEYIDEVRRDFEESLKGIKLSDGKLSFTKTFGATQRKATVYYTEVAWQKMQTLIREFDKEIAWHGLAYRGEDPEKDEYTITDILVYPQEVTGATVTTDQTEYQTWLFNHEDDVFNNIRMQGHSHVNMSTSPSGVDTSLYERILDQLDDTMFYIFLIYNKRGDKTYKIYDLAKNVLFETGDVEVKILGNGFDMNEFLADAKSKVRDKVYKPQSPYVSPYSTYGTVVKASELPKSAFPTTPATTKAPEPTKPAPAPVKQTAPAVSSNKFDKLRKGRKKDRNKNEKSKYTGGYSGTGLRSAYGFDDDDVYGPFGYRDTYYYE